MSGGGINRCSGVMRDVRGAVGGGNRFGGDGGGGRGSGGDGGGGGNDYEMAALAEGV